MKKFIDEILDTRKQQSLFYDNLLEAFNIQKQKIHSKAKYNYSYYPVVFESENFTLKVKEELEKNKNKFHALKIDLTNFDELQNTIPAFLKTLIILVK